MFKYVFWLGIVLIGLVEIGLHNSDLTVPLTSDVWLYSSATARGRFALSSFTRGGLIDDVLAYRLLDNGSIVGRTPRAFFVVGPTGEPTLFDDKTAWLNACEVPTLELAAPARWDDPTYWTIQRTITIGLVVWVVAGAIIVRMKIKYRREAARYPAFQMRQTEPDCGPADSR